MATGWEAGVAGGVALALEAREAAVDQGCGPGRRGSSGLGPSARNNGRGKHAEGDRLLHPRLESLQTVGVPPWHKAELAEAAWMAVGCPYKAEQP